MSKKKNYTFLFIFFTAFPQRKNHAIEIHPPNKESCTKNNYEMFPESTPLNSVGNEIQDKNEKDLEKENEMTNESLRVTRESLKQYLDKVNTHTSIVKEKLKESNSTVKERIPESVTSKDSKDKNDPKDVNSAQISCTPDNKNAVSA